jgi:hypothetical protein
MKPADLERSVFRMALLTALLTVVLLAELGVMAWYSYVRVSTALEPANVVKTAEAAVRENYPAFRRRLVAEVKKEAPAIAERVSHRLITASPELRQWLEEFTARQLEHGLDEATDLSAEEFRRFLRENHDQIEKVLARIEHAPDEAHRLVLEMESRIRAEFGVDVQQQAHTALIIHRQLNTKLAHLTDPNAELTPREELERRILRILRTLEQQPT